MAWKPLFTSEEEALDATKKHLIYKKVERKELCVGQHKGKLFAIDDVCPHEGAPLSEGALRADGKVVCPFHFYLFDAFSGECVGGICDSVASYPLKIEEDGVMIDL